MTAVWNELEIHVHLVDGSVQKYEQGESGAIAEILKHVSPARFFGQMQFMIAGKYSITGYSCSSVERVDFVAEHYPDWPSPHGVEAIGEIDEAEFLVRYRPDSAASGASSPSDPTSAKPVEAFLQLDMVSGRRIYLMVTLPWHDAIDERIIVTHLLTSGIPARRLGGGALLINAANIAFWRLYPAPREVPQNAWPAHRLAE